MKVIVTTHATVSIRSVNGSRAQLTSNTIATRSEVFGFIMALNRILCANSNINTLWIPVREITHWQLSTFRGGSMRDQSIQHIRFSLEQMLSTSGMVELIYISSISLSSVDVRMQQHRHFDSIGGETVFRYSTTSCCSGTIHLNCEKPRTVRYK